jgi:hypothetical protein
LASLGVWAAAAGMLAECGEVWVAINGGFFAPALAMRSLDCHELRALLLAAACACRERCARG